MNQFKYEVLCLKVNKKSPYRKVKNNFVKELSLIKMGNVGYKVLVENKHRGYEIDATGGSDNDQSVTLSYQKDRFKEGSQEYVVFISIKDFPYEKYEMLLDRNKETLEIFFIKKVKNQKMIKNISLLKEST